MKIQKAALPIGLMIIAWSVSAFSACNEGGEAKVTLLSSTPTQIVMRIEETDGRANAFNAIHSLMQEGALSFEYTEGPYGAYITSINGKAEANTESTATTSKGFSWILYTSDTDNAYVSETILVEDTVCGKAAKGASALTVKTGELYVWVYEAYDYSF